MVKKFYVSKKTKARTRELYRVLTQAFRSAAELAWFASDRVKSKVPDFFKDLLRLPPIGGCSHRKGMGPYKNAKTEFGPTVFPRDYDVYLHTFIDSSQRIHCRRCGQNWFPGQPGWADAVSMTKQSTNRESASESPLFNLAEPGAREAAIKWLEKGRALAPANEEPLVMYHDTLLEETDGITEDNISEDFREQS